MQSESKNVINKKTFNSLAVIGPSVLRAKSQTLTQFAKEMPLEGKGLLTVDSGDPIINRAGNEVYEIHTQATKLTEFPRLS